MKEQNLALFDKEEAYSLRLAGYLNRCVDFPFHVSVFTNKEGLDYFRKEQAITLLIIDKAEEEIQNEIEKDTPVITFVHSRLEADSPNTIFKYQSARKIMEEIMAVSTIPPTKKETRKEDKPDIYTILSGTSKERRKAIREILRKEERETEVLSVHMELFPEEEEILNQEWTGMSEAIYYLKQNTNRVAEESQGYKSDKGNSFTNIDWKIKSLIRDGEFGKVLMPAYCGMDLFEITQKDIHTFLQVLQSYTEFSTILIEIDFYNETMLEILSESKTIYLLTEKEGIQKETHFKRQMELMGKEEVARKVEVIRYCNEFGAKKQDERSASRKDRFFKRLER